MTGNHVGSAVKIWNLVKGLSTVDLARRAALPVTVRIVGSQSAAWDLTTRLASETEQLEPSDNGSVKRVTRYHADSTMPVTANEIVLDADRAHSEEELTTQLEHIAAHNKPLRVALAAAIPAFRPIVTDQLAHEFAMTNAKVAALSALPGIVPMGDWLMPLTAAGDIFVLTRNQMALFLEVAACYGLPPDLQARAREFAVVVGGAFFWRTAARQIVGIVPGGVGVAVKAGIAFTGTYAVGKAAALYFRRGGHRIGPRELTALLRKSGKHRTTLQSS